MAETLRIEIPIETIDETAAGLNSAIQGLKKLEQAYKHAGDSARKSGSKVTEFDRQAEKTERTLASWAKQKYEVLLEAKERISPVLSTVGSGIRGVAGKTWNITMKAVDLVTSPVRGILNILKNPVFQAGSILGISIGLKDTIDTYKNFEAAMSQVEAISGATASDMGKLNEKAKEMGATTKFTATESAEALNYMAMAGWKTEDMLNGIDGILNLAAASGESLGTTSDIVTDSLTAFGMKADEVGHFADVMAVAASNSNTNVSLMGETFKYAGSMAGTLKYSIEDVALATGLMANAGIKGNMAGTALNSIFTRLSTNTHGATDALKKLGIEYFNQNGSARDLSDVLEELRAATKNFTDEQKAQLGNTIAGTYAQKGFLAILNATEEDYEKLSKAVNHADGAAANMAEIMMDNLQGSITLLQSAWDGVKMTAGGRIAPYIRDFADWLTAQMPAIDSAVEELMDFMDRKIEQVKSKFFEISNTKEWQEADFLGKVHIAWDVFIAEPFSEWWSGTGKAKFANFAQDIGAGLGSGMKTGIMALFGIDLSETLDEGVSIGASFARGFSKGFDFDLISGKLWEGLGNLVKNAGKLLPGGEKAGLSSVFSAALLMKIASPFIGMGRGMFGMGRALFGAPAGGTSLVGRLLGSTGNVMVSGSGLLGKFANVGYGLTGGGNTAGVYFGNTAGAMSGGTAALIGAGSTTGAIAAGATLISGVMDAHKAFNSKDKDEAAAYAESGAWKVGGVGAGAAAGAAIGSVIPGLGTAAGALIGAGIGGLAGWAQGNKAKEKYEQNLEEAQQAAERAQKIFAATGLSIDEVSFANKELQEAIQDTEVSAEQAALWIQEDVVKVAKEAFGDIKLSLTEIKELAAEITFGEMKAGLEEFQKVTEDTQSSLSTLKSCISDMRKQNWHVNLGMQLSESEQEKYKQSIDDFVSSAQAYIENSHYEATVALRLLMGADSDPDTSGLDSYYNNLNTRVKDLQQQLIDVVDKAMEDGVISTEKIVLPDGTLQLSEADEIKNLQNQISDITNHLAEAQNEASLQALEIKYSGAALDYDSFTSLQEELKANAQMTEASYDEALKVSLTNLRLQLEGGDIDADEYHDRYEKIRDDYYKQINDLNNGLETFNLNTIADSFSDQLDGILPGMEGTLSEKMSEVMHKALIINPDAASWTQEDVKNWFDLDGIETSAFETIFAELKATASMVPKAAKDELLQGYKEMVPTKEEIMETIDFTQMTLGDWYDLLNLVDPLGEGEIRIDVTGKTKPMLDADTDDFKKQIESHAEEIRDALLKNKDMDIFSEFTDRYMNGTSGGFYMEKAMEQHGPISNESYEEMLEEYKEKGENLGNAVNTGVTDSITLGQSIYRQSAESAIFNAFSDPFNVTANIYVTPRYGGSLRTGLYDGETQIAGTGAFSDLYDGTGKKTGGKSPFVSLGSGAEKNAAGGYISGGPILSWLAEEGYGEFVIPTNPSRRTRALELYEQAGEVLGVSAHAAGGYVGGPVLSDMSANNHSADIFGTNDLSNYGYAEYDDSHNTMQAYEPVAAEHKTGISNAPVQVNINMSPEFIVNSNHDTNDEDIIQVFRRHLREMADELGGEIAEKLGEVFSNVPRTEA